MANPIQVATTVDMDHRSHEPHQEWMICLTYSRTALPSTIFLTNTQGKKASSKDR